MKEGVQLIVRNTLAYCKNKFIMVVKSFIPPASGFRKLKAQAGVLKTFAAVILEITLVGLLRSVIHCITHE
jgi:hypothetical protein